MPANSQSHPADAQGLDRLTTILDSRLTRLGLAALVIISLLPMGSLGWWRLLFVLAFGAELVGRFILWRKDVEGHRLVTVVGVAFAVVDVLAFLSFLPMLAEHDAFSLLRLTRLFMLVRFGQGIARDLYAVLTRREQLQTLGLVTGAVVVLSFVSAVILSQLRVDNATHNESFRERVWWSFRQLESADNIVPDLTGEPVLIVLSLVLTICGVFLISFVIGVGSNVVDQVVRAERRRDLHYRGHTLVIGAVHESEELIREFVRIYAKNRQVPTPERLLTWLRYRRPHGARTFPRVALLSRDDETPGFLVEPIMRWVVYRQGDESEPESLQRVAAKHAKRAILLAKREHGLETDAVTISALAALRAQNPDCHAYVEVDDPEAKDIVLQVGGDNTVVLDVPRFLGMFLCQHLLMPGVESLYKDLLTSDGTEIYTHLFVDDSEHEALAKLPPTLSFAALSQLASERGVHLLGVYLGTQAARRNARDVVQMANMCQWLNPGDNVSDESLLALGATCGQIPTQMLRGIIGIAESYLPLRSYADAVCHGAAAKDHAVVVDAIVAAALQAPKRGPSRVALIGFSESVPALLRELSLFVPGVDVSLFLSSRGGNHGALARRLESLNVGFDVDDVLPGRNGREFQLARGGILRVYSHDAPDLAHFAVDRLQQQAPVEAAVFLCEPDGTDKDARTAMRVLRFLRSLEDGSVPHSERMHLVAEFVSVDKGQYLQQHVDVRRCGFATTEDLRLTLIARDTVKSYFMVHAAFVPGVSAVYEELLEERGQDMVRLRVVTSTSTPTTWHAVCEAARARRAVAVGFERKDGSIVVAPAAHTALDLADVSGVYAVAESATA